MRYSREQLATRFAKLDAELGRLSRSHASEEELWSAFEHLAQVPSSTIDPADCRWWWEQIYSLMERYGLTELSRHAYSGR